MVSQISAMLDVKVCHLGTSPPRCQHPQEHQIKLFWNCRTEFGVRSDWETFLCQRSHYWSICHQPVAPFLCPFISLSTEMCPNHPKDAIKSIKMHKLPRWLNPSFHCFCDHCTDTLLFYIRMLTTAWRENVRRCYELWLNPRWYE